VGRRRYNRVFRGAAAILGASVLTAPVMTPSAGHASAGPAMSLVAQTVTANATASGGAFGTAATVEGATKGAAAKGAAAAKGTAAAKGAAAKGAAAAKGTAAAKGAAAKGTAAAKRRGKAAAGKRACAHTLNVVAHEDDDLLFINPSVSDDIAAGRCVVTLFVTAGDSGRPPSYWLDRERGAMAAYAEMSGTSSTWNSDTILLAGHSIVRQSLVGTRITLLFMRLPDAHGNPNRPFGTLQALWEGQVRTLRALTGGGTYTRQSLIKTVLAAMVAYQPDRIRTLDYAGHYGDGDHADHHTVGFVTLAAQQSYRAYHEISAYRGYTVADYPDNLDESASYTKLSYFLAYAPYDSKVCQDADACMANFYGPRFTHSLTTSESVS